MELKMAIFILSIWTLSFSGAYVYSQPSKHIDFYMKPMLDIFLAWILGLFLPVLAYIQIVYFITFADFAIAVINVFAMGEVFSWRKARYLIAKFAAWGLLLAVCYQIQLLLHIPAIHIGDLELSIAAAVAGVIGYAETKSILNNIKKGFGIDIQAFIFDKIGIAKAFDSDKQPSSTPPHEINENSDIKF